MVSAGDFAVPLTAAMVQRAADGSPDFSPFALATGSHLIDAGVVPAGDLPFPSSYFRGEPVLGGVENVE